MIQISRDEPRDMNVIDDGISYTHDQIESLLYMIDDRVGPRGQMLQRKISAFGLFGFVRFYGGYYMILITKRRHVAMIGQHKIYKVGETVCTC